jgi:hypothetical protein
LATASYSASFEASARTIQKKGSGDFPDLCLIEIMYPGIRGGGSGRKACG